jgi:hypothetical protein
MPRFSIKDLLWSTTLIAAGFGVFVITVRAARGEPNWILWHGSGALAGAGILFPFRHPWIGAVFGAVLMDVFLFWLYARAF